MGAALQRNKALASCWLAAIRSENNQFSCWLSATVQEARRRPWAVACRAIHSPKTRVVGSDTIYVSSDDGKAEYVPELKLWFGLSGDHPYSLCACDLTNTQGQLHTWLDLDIPESWLPIHLDIISLGSGRFCVAKMFFSMRHDDQIESQFAVLTGLQMVRPIGTKDDQQVPWMVKHKSIYYPFGYYNIQQVF
uniref:Uncharacterized protein n=1 Tax=Oryza punctata TaxID=4537 RepID=A0A0E0MC15_ORYPU